MRALCLIVGRRVLEAAQPNFYVYMHTRLDNGRVFYVGKGRGKRASSVHGRSERWSRVARKHGFKALVVADGLAEADAFAKEKILILFHRHMGSPLTNVTDGGEGVSGHTMSVEAKAKMRAAKLGRSLSVEHRQKIAASHLGSKRSDEQRANMRRPFTDEHKRKIRISATGRKMSAEAIEKMAATKRGKRASPEYLARRIGILAGPKNPHHSDKIYIFAHVSHGRKECTQFDLRSEFGLAHSNLSKVVSGERLSVKGWRLVGIKP